MFKSLRSPGLKPTITFFRSRLTDFLFLGYLCVMGLIFFGFETSTNYRPHIILLIRFCGGLYRE